jgi:hypothetical protein
MPIAILRGAVAAVRAVRRAIALLQKVLKPIRAALWKAEHEARSLSKAARGINKSAMPKVGIRIDGLREFRRELRKLSDDGTWTRALREVNAQVAQEALREVQRLAQTQPRIIGKRRRPEREHWSDYVGSFRVVASQTSAGIRLGSTVRRKGWYMGSNFGSHGRFKQFPGQSVPDHALYKGIEQALPRTVERYGDALDRLAKKAFPD